MRPVQSVRTRVLTSLIAMSCIATGTQLSAQTGVDEEAEAAAAASDGVPPGAGRGNYVKPVDPDIVEPKRHSGAFVGLGAAFGQARSTDGGSGDVSFRVGIEPGFQMGTGSWSRLEVGAELYSGRIGFRAGTGDESYKAKMPIGLGLMPKIGYGYSLGSDLYAVWKLGVGPVMAKFSGDRTDGAELEADDTLWGIAGQIGAQLAFPATDMLAFMIGLDLTHYQFDLGTLKVRADGASETKVEGRSVIVNATNASVGMRMKF